MILYKKRQNNDITTPLFSLAATVKLLGNIANSLMPLTH